MTYTYIEDTVVAGICPNDGMIAHWFPRSIGFFIGCSQYMHVLPGALVKLIPFIAYRKAPGQVTGYRMIAVFHQYHALLKGWVRGIDNISHQLFKPLPIGSFRLYKLRAREAGGMD